MTMGPATEPSAREVVISRVIDAPRPLVFRAWTEREHLVRWHAPQGCTIEFRSFDARPGGTFHSCIHGPDGHACWCKGVYREVVAPERIVYDIAISDEQGRSVEPADAGMDPEWPRETTVTVTFAEHGAGTLLTLHQTVSETVAKRTGAHPSWLSMLDRLEEEIVVT